MNKKSWLKEKMSVWTKMVEIERGVFMKKKSWLKENSFFFEEKELT